MRVLDALRLGSLPQVEEQWPSYHAPGGATSRGDMFAGFLRS